MADTPKTVASYMDAGEDLTGRQMPYHLEAEQSVLGSILIDPGCLSAVLEYIKAESFYRRQHKELFTIMVAMFSSGLPIDFVTVLERAVAEGVFESDQAARIYLAQLAQIVPTTVNVEAYARIVQEKYQLRCLMNVAKEVLQSASEAGEQEPSALLDMAEQKLFEIRQGRETAGLQRIDEIIISSYDHLQRLTGDDKDQYLGMSTGFSDLDTILTGLNKSDLILVAARCAEYRDQRSEKIQQKSCHLQPGDE